MRSMEHAARRRTVTSVTQIGVKLQRCFWTADDPSKGSLVDDFSDTLAVVHMVWQQLLNVELLLPRGLPA